VICCLTGLVVAGNVAAGGVALRTPRWRMALLGAMLVAGLAVAPAVAEHAGHYAARAAANERSVLAELLAQPLCSGAGETR
jgi:hypothetical protein